MREFGVHGDWTDWVDGDKRSPDFTGPHGRAWRAPASAINNRGTIAYWLTFQPESHPIWPWCLIALVTLKPLDEFPPPIIHVEGATHELVVHALNPDKGNIVLDDPKSLHILEPTNFAAQWIASDDAEAIARVERMAIDPICYGILNQDTDGMKQWVDRFGDSMVKKYASHS